MSIRQEVHYYDYYDYYYYDIDYYIMQMIECF